MRKRSWLWLLLLACAGAHAQTQVVTELPQQAQAYPGSEYRDAVGRATAYFQQGRKDAAWNVLQPALLYCDDLKNEGDRRYYSVADKSEEREFRREAPAGARLTFVDMACPMAYKSAAFLAVDAKEYERAFAMLDRAHAIAPHWPEALAERAYLVGQLGDSARSLDYYRQALALVEKYPRSRYLKGLVLRGIGYQLVEAGDLAGAETAYRDSLRVEPDNALAQRELEYVRGRRAEQGGKAD